HKFLSTRTHTQSFKFTTTPEATLFPYTTLFRSSNIQAGPGHNWANAISMATPIAHKGIAYGSKVIAMTVIDLVTHPELVQQAWEDRKSTRLNSSHLGISYAVFCLKKKINSLRVS